MPPDSRVESALIFAPWLSRRISTRRCRWAPYLALLCVLASVGAIAQVEPPCGNVYGSAADRAALENELYSGTVEGARGAINAAKVTRGSSVGCPDTAWTRVPPELAPPGRAAVESLWSTVHLPGLAAYVPHACAPLGREWSAAGLGGHYARLAGYPAPEEALRALAQDLADAQYSVSVAPAPLITYPGLYAYAHTMAEPESICYRPGGIAEAIGPWCGAIAAYCPAYNAGIWSGAPFLVADFSLLPRAYDGGAAYDHGWSAQFMIEAWLQETDLTLRGQLEASALLAGAWSRDEPAVRNHNYTAKLIWVLAQLYGATGDVEWKTALTDKLERSLKPGVLMDLDQDGKVDGMAGQAFSELSPVAQLPGRMWDGHNSIAWYQCMNAWAMLEAYVAFRDRGDMALAAESRPYVVAMFDNLAAELNTLGTATQANVGEGIHPLPFGLALAIWKLALHEHDPRPAWESALWGLYNTGYFNTFQANRSTAALGVVLLIVTGAPYTPLPQRPAAGEGEVEGETTVLALDRNADHRVQLGELLRVIQFYNSLGLHCAGNPGDTEDGFVPGAGANQSCVPYDTDYNPQDWVISLTELLRVIQFYNSLGYRYCPLDGTEDGFCPGL